MEVVILYTRKARYPNDAKHDDTIHTEVRVILESLEQAVWMLVLAVMMVRPVYKGPVSGL